MTERTLELLKILSVTYIDLQEGTGEDIEERQKDKETETERERDREKQTVKKCYNQENKGRKEDKRSNKDKKGKE